MALALLRRAGGGALAGSDAHRHNTADVRQRAVGDGVRSRRRRRSVACRNAGRGAGLQPDRGIAARHRRPRMKILVIHQYYLAASDPGGSRFNELARLWTDAGHTVTVVAGAVNYATGQTAPNTKGWVARVIDNGIDVRRCYVPSSYTRGYLGRMWAFFGFTLTSTLAAIRAPRPDVVVATSPPLTTGLTGWIASRRHRVPWVFEVRDLWPESAVTTGVLRERAPLTRLLYAIERFACRRADVINVLTPAFADDIERR